MVQRTLGMLPAGAHRSAKASSLFIGGPAEGSSPATLRWTWFPDSADMCHVLGRLGRRPARTRMVSMVLLPVWAS